PSTSTRASTGRLDARALDQWARLRGGNRRRTRDHPSGGNAEGYLRGDEPKPGDSRVQRRIDHAQGGPEQAGPEQRREQAAPQQMTSRQQRQDGRVQRADEYGGHAVGDQADHQRDAVESPQGRDLG